MQISVHEDVRIDVRVDGSSGDAIVLIHGFPLSKVVWDAQIAALAQRHRVVAVDLRGMGSSSVSEGPYLMEMLAGDIAAVLDHLGIERATLVGHSLGGYVALAFARMYGERVARLALVCSRITRDTEQRASARLQTAQMLETVGIDDAMIAQLVDSLFLEENREKMRENVQKTRKILENSNAAGLAAMLRGMALRDSSEDIAPDLEMPVLVVASRQDPVVPYPEAEAMAAAFRHGRLVTLEHSGHLPMLEEPEAVNEALAAFTGG